MGVYVRNTTTSIYLKNLQQFLSSRVFLTYGTASYSFGSYAIPNDQRSINQPATGRESMSSQLEHVEILHSNLVKRGICTCASPSKDHVLAHASLSSLCYCTEEDIAAEFAIRLIASTCIMHCMLHDQSDLILSSTHSPCLYNLQAEECQGRTSFLLPP